MGRDTAVLIMKGFTLIELVVVAGIVILMASLILANYQGSQRQQALRRSIHRLAQDLRRAQEMAASSQDFEANALPGGYGIYLTSAEPKHYLLFANTLDNQKYDPVDDSIVEDIRLEAGVNITSLSDSPLSIIFIPPNPIVSIDPEADFASITLNGQETIRIHKSGLIEIE